MSIDKGPTYKLVRNDELLSLRAIARNVRTVLEQNKYNCFNGKVLLEESVYVYEELKENEPK